VLPGVAFTAVVILSIAGIFIVNKIGGKYEKNLNNMLSSPKKGFVIETPSYGIDYLRKYGIEVPDDSILKDAISGGPVNISSNGGVLMLTTADNGELMVALIKQGPDGITEYRFPGGDTNYTFVSRESSIWKTFGMSFDEAYNMKTLPDSAIQGNAQKVR